MRIRWKGFEIPSAVVPERETLTPTYGKFSIEPFERGYGVTIGNSLRRILLSSLEGAAVTHCKMEGVGHEFSTIPGMYQDVSEFILNVKKLLFKLHGDEKRTVRLSASGIGPVTAGQIECDHNIEVINKDFVLCELTEADAQLNVEFTVDKGRSYRTAEENDTGNLEIGVIPVASIFTPIIRVRYKTEETRVGQMTNFDRLVMELWTDGSITPEMALVEAAKILRKHLSPFIQYFETSAMVPHDAQSRGSVYEEKRRQGELDQIINRPVAELELSMRTQNCLEAADILTVGELIQKSEAEMLVLKNLGKTSLEEIKAKLQEFSLSLGMDVPSDAAAPRV